MIFDDLDHLKIHLSRFTIYEESVNLKIVGCPSSSDGQMI